MLCYFTTWQGCEGRGLPSHPVWMMWRSRWYLRLNCLLQRVHEYGFSPGTWSNIYIPVVLWSDLERAAGNWSSYSPVCVYMCRARVPLSGQRASHSGQEYVSPSKWITRRCRSRLDFNLKFFAQSTHSNSPPCKHMIYYEQQWIHVKYRFSWQWAWRPLSSQKWHPVV